MCLLLGHSAVPTQPRVLFVSLVSPASTDRTLCQPLEPSFPTRHCSSLVWIVLLVVAVGAWRAGARALCLRRWLLWKWRRRRCCRFAPRFWVFVRPSCLLPAPASCVIPVPDRCPRRSFLRARTAILFRGAWAHSSVCVVRVQHAASLSCPELADEHAFESVLSPLQRYSILPNLSSTLALTLIRWQSAMSSRFAVGRGWMLVAACCCG